MTGTIKTKTDRGFGFIKQDDGGKDVFFHVKDLANCSFDDLKIGDKVEYGVKQTEKGAKAIDVAVI